MIFTKVDALVKDIDVDKYHIETVILSSDDLNKKIIRVKSDHGNEFGIRLDKGQKLQNGSAFFIDDHHVLAIGVESQDLIVISPKDMDEMGITAHILGNTHKPIEVKDAKIYLEVDPVVEHHYLYDAQGECHQEISSRLKKRLPTRLKKWSLINPYAM